MMLADLGARVAAALAPLGTAATLTRGASSWPCAVIEEDVNRGVTGPFASDERSVIVLGLTGTEPQPRDRLTIHGTEILTIQRAARTGMGSAWTLSVKR